MYVHVCDMYVPKSGNISPPTGITKEEDQMSERPCLSTKYIKMSCQTAEPKRGKVLPLHLYSVRLLVTVNVYLNLSCALINSIAFKLKSVEGRGYHGAGCWILSIPAPAPECDKGGQIAEPSTDLTVLSLP